LRVWVTRARPQAEDTAGRLRALGHTPLVAPLLQVRPLPAALDLAGVAALAFTSRNGVAAFAARELRRAWPVFAVGDATAEAARAAGFGEVSSAGGDVAALAALIARRPPLGPVLHAGAAEAAGDLAGLLAARRVPTLSAALYETLVLAPAPEACAAWPELDAVLIHSPKAARALAAAAHALGTACPAQPRLLAISDAAAAPLRTTLGAAEVALCPDEAALLALLDPAAALVAEPPAR